MNQRILNKVVAMATKEALAGTPVERIIWLPPANASDDQDGSFVVIHCTNVNASDTPVWEL